VVEIPDGGNVPQLLLASRVAWMHYKEGSTNLDIAAKLGISRFRVARLLELGLRSGIVQITINPPVEVDQKTSSALISRFGLVEALVFPVAEGLPESQDRRLLSDSVGRLAALYLAEILKEGGKFGVTWGNALESVARAVAAIGSFPRADVVQMVGGLSAASNSIQAMDVLARFASGAGGELSALHAPLVVSDLQTAEGLRGEPSIKQTLSQVSQLDAAVVGIGSWDPPASQMIPLFSQADIDQAMARDAAADVCAIIIDKEGNELLGDFSSHTIRASSDDFRGIPYVIGVASGVGKARAVRAVLAGRWANVLVTDSRLAMRLLEDD
jgi:DNA-binding transcriptional regulator LsrR (DeoR family)